MQSFLEEVVFELSQEYDSLEDVIFVLPSKRAGTFLRNIIAANTTQTSFAPIIYSIEEFVEIISGLTYASNTQQLFQLYAAYLQNTTTEKDNFFTFSKWGQTLLQDFNEIDRYLIDAKKLFSNLADIQEINHWSQGEITPMIQKYITFWNNLYQLYFDFNTTLLDQGLGHQGLVYRHACEELENYLAKTENKTHAFIGFNALNTAETHIIQTLLKAEKNTIYWDIDSCFLNDPIHDAGFFIRKHLNTWSYFKKTDLKGISTNYNTKKDIQITGVPKNISQAKYVGSLLQKINIESPEDLKKTALILGEEGLLNPILNSIPKEIDAVNITMGYPLNKAPVASLFIDFFELYLYRDPRGWFHQNIVSFLSHPYITTLLRPEESKNNQSLATHIKRKNWTYITIPKIQSISTNTKLDLLFFEHQPSPKQFITYCLEIISELKLRFLETQNNLGLEYLYQFHTLFNQILELVQKYSFINDLKSLQSIFEELLSSETVDFQGDPLEGLQIMGMLESRNLDFETVIITSVNEGILPSGKSNNSFIPFDLKTALGLPTYKEKDAVYTYHFYRLLQRAKTIHIIYNTEPDVLEGREKSRLIAQLQTDSLRIPDIKEKVISPAVQPIVQKLECIQKDNGLMALIKNHAQKGFSPTSLCNYIRNPIDFYKRNLLGIEDILEVEETVAANTFGTIVHDTLEDLYTPFVGDYLSKEGLTKVKSKIQPLVKKHFIKTYMNGNIDHGKNLIAKHVIERYIESFINQEIEEIKNHKIKIISLEDKLNVTLDVPGIDFEVILKGKLDRIDEKDGVLRIIDYKTGKVESKNVEIVDWEEVTTNYDRSKAFQLLCYAFMFNGKKTVTSIETGIISFKNLKEGLLRFATKEKKGSRKKDYPITQDTLSLFYEELKTLIQEICNSEIPFTEKEV